MRKKVKPAKHIKLTKKIKLIILIGLCFILVAGILFNNSSYKTTLEENMATKKISEDCLAKENNIAIAVCIIVSAEKLKDESLCESISLDNMSGLQDTCYTKVASAKMDENICSLINDETGNLDNCIGEVAIRKGDSSLCEKISRQEEKDRCTNEVARFLA